MTCRAEESGEVSSSERIVFSILMHRHKLQFVLDAMFLSTGFFARNSCNQCQNRLSWTQIYENISMMCRVKKNIFKGSIFSICIAFLFRKQCNVKFDIFRLSIRFTFLYLYNYFLTVDQEFNKLNSFVMLYHNSDIKTIIQRVYILRNIYNIVIINYEEESNDSIVESGEYNKQEKSVLFFHHYIRVIRVVQSLLILIAFFDLARR